MQNNLTPSFEGDMRSIQHMHSQNVINRSSPPPWAITPDIFWVRYYHTDESEGIPWRVLPHFLTITGHSPSSRRSSILPTAPLPLTQLLLEPWHPHTPQDNDASLHPRGSSSATRPRLLFQYKPYHLQEPLHASSKDIAAILSAAFSINTSEALPATPSMMQPRHQRASHSTSHIACVILIKLTIDLYLKAGAQAAYPLTVYMLEKALMQGGVESRCTVFDFLFNLAVHGELLYDSNPIFDDLLAEEEEEMKKQEYHRSGDTHHDPGSNSGWKSTITSAFKASLGPLPAAHQHPEPDVVWPQLPDDLSFLQPQHASTQHAIINPKVENFRQWLRLLLYRMLRTLCSMNAEENSPAWSAAVACLIALSSYRGTVLRAFIEDIPFQALAVLLRLSAGGNWPVGLHNWLVSLTTNLLYKRPSVDDHQPARCTDNHVYWRECQLDVDRLREFGGIDMVVCMYKTSSTHQSKRCFFSVMFDYCVMEMKASSDASGGNRKDVLSFLGTALIHVRAAEVIHSLFLSKSVAEKKGTSSVEYSLASFILPEMHRHHRATSREPLSASSEELISACISRLCALLQPSYMIDRRGGALPHHAELRGSSVDEDQRYIIDTVSTVSQSSAQLSSAASWDALQTLLLSLSTSPLSSSPSSSPPNAPIASLRASEWLQHLFLAFYSCTTCRPRTILPPLPTTGEQSPHSMLSRLLYSVMTSPSCSSYTVVAFMDAVCKTIDHIRLVALTLTTTTTTTTTATTTTTKPERTSLQQHDTIAQLLSNLSRAIDWMMLTITPAVRQQALVLAVNCMLSLVAARRLDSAAERTLVAMDHGENPESNIYHDHVNDAYHFESATAARTSTSTTTRVAASPHGLHKPSHAAVSAPLRDARQGPRSTSTGAASLPSQVQSQQHGRASLSHAGAAPPASNGSFGGRPPSPLVRLMPGTKIAAAWRRLTGPHTQNDTAGPPSIVKQQQQHQQQQEQGQASTRAEGHEGRPLSAGIALLGSGPGPVATMGDRMGDVPVHAAAIPPLSPAVQEPYDPHDEAVLSFHQQQGGGLNATSLQEIAEEKQRQEKLHRTVMKKHNMNALATIDDTCTSLGSFLLGLSGISMQYLDLVSPILLKTLFDELDPGIDTPALSGKNSGAPLVRSSSAKHLANSKAAAFIGRGSATVTATNLPNKRLAAVGARRSCSDARVAVAALLLQRCAAHHEESSKESVCDVGGILTAESLALLLYDDDVRVRHHVSLFVLQRLAEIHPAKYKHAMRAVVAKAQRGDDEHVLFDPVAQVQMILEMRTVTLDMIVRV